MKNLSILVLALGLCFGAAAQSGNWQQAVATLKDSSCGGKNQVRVRYKVTSGAMGNSYTVEVRHGNGWIPKHDTRNGSDNDERKFNYAGCTYVFFGMAD